MIAFLRTIIYEPLYNVLIFLVDIIPGGSIALAVIILTVLIKVILFPLNKKAIISQIKLKQLEPELNKIKQDFPDKQEQSQKTMEFYKKNKVSPFSSCLPMLIQLPVILSLYYVFINGIDLNSEIIYSFTSIPDVVNSTVFGFGDIGDRSIFFALLAGVSQFFQARIVSARSQTPEGGDQNSIQAKIGKSMQMQMKYVFPIIIVVIAFNLSAAVALYWVVNNVITIVQELLIKRKLEEKMLNVEIVNQ